MRVGGGWRAGLVLALLCTFVPVSAPAEPDPVALGRRLYREGIGVSGEPVEAIVQGDIPVDGTMFTCQSCHLRSGLGSVEGTVITLPTHAVWLYNPRPGINSLRLILDPDGIRPRFEELPHLVPPGDLRPAYTDESLARAIRFGVDPSGDLLSPTMPRYLLGDRDMAALIAYLKTLSAEFSPGVDEKALHLATVIAGEVPEARREALLSVLRTMVRDHNAQWRAEARRAAKGPFYRQEMNVGFRNWELHEWELRGPPESWGAQLARRYAERPVFALVGGLAEGPWEPVHRFCEEHEIPCLFPVTDLPVVNRTDWYTVYFDKGYVQDGEAAAKYLRKELPAGAGALQVVRLDPPGRRLAQGFRGVWERTGRSLAVREVPGTAGPLSAGEWEEALRGAPAVLAWVGPQDLPGLAEALRAVDPAPVVILPGRRFRDALGRMPGAIRARGLFTWPYILPRDAGRREFGVRAWLRARKIPERDLEVQEKMYFVAWALPPLLAKIRNLWYRDYLLDRVDMKRDEETSIALYPRLTFGQGQRYASKACYIVRLGAGDPPKLEPLTPAVIF